MTPRILTDDALDTVSAGSAGLTLTADGTGTTAAEYNELSIDNCDPEAHRIPKGTNPMDLKR